jgi:hypothetical protein
LTSSIAEVWYASKGGSHPCSWLLS